MKRRDAMVWHGIGSGQQGMQACLLRQMFAVSLSLSSFVDLLLLTLSERTREERIREDVQSWTKSQTTILALPADGLRVERERDGGCCRSPSAAGAGGVD